MDLAEIRKEIDALDDELLTLFLKRMELSLSAGRAKRSAGLAILDSNRESEILLKIASLAGEELDAYAKTLYETIFSLCRSYQRDKLGLA